MRVEDAATRAGEELRVRFKGTSAPELRRAPRRSPARTALVVAVVVVLAAVGLTTVVRSVRTSSVSADRNRDGATWATVGFDSAVGSDATIERVTGGRAGFVAGGGIGHRCPAGGSPISCSTTSLWRSADGARWVRDLDAPENAGQVVALETNGDLVAMLAIRDAGSVRSWTSKNGGKWRRGEVVTNDALAHLRPWRNGFIVSIGTGNHWNARSSADGLHWRDVRPGRGLSGFPPAARLGREFLSLDNRRVPPRVLGSSDALTWHILRSHRSPSVIGSNEARTLALGIVARSGPPGGSAHVYSTSTGTTWSEAFDFNTRFPEAEPVAIAASGRWWILSGNQYASGTFQPKVWISADLQHWIGRPIGIRRPADLVQRPLRIAVGGRSVVAINQNDRSIVVWHRPRQVPTFVTLAGVARSVGGPLGAGSIVHTVWVENADGREVARVQVSAEGRYAVDLPPGRYRLRTECERGSVTLRRGDVRRDLVCQIK